MKETLCDKCKKEQPSHSCQDITALGRCYIEGMNTADKVEPKFKVGDWVVYNRTDYSNEIMQIYDIRDGRYYFNDNIHFSWSIKECDEKSHLWSIQDAKDGDVLVDKDNNIGIFQECEGIYWNSYIYLGCDGTLRGFSIGGKHEQTDAHPATKEQRDLLFQKMKEAGYEWDAEKKELKKIHLIDEGKDEIDYCFTKMMNGEKASSTWSEEDESYLNTTIAYLKDAKEFKKTAENCINWLKSLKYRSKKRIALL